MLVASLVDLDEQTIPDWITVPGTLVGLLLAAFFPRSLLPTVVDCAGGKCLDFLTLASPNDWPAPLAGWPNASALVLALACYLAWCAALLPWRLYLRRGWRQAARLQAARVRRDPTSALVAALAIVGSIGIASGWWFGGPSWRGLLSALVGVAAGGALMWAVRIAAGWAVGREAMGFGDVTLLAMIGSFLGWQTGPIVFFLAPIAGLVVGVAQWIAYRDNVIPYGPFLCLAATVVTVFWGPIWAWALPLYGVSWLVPGALAVCLVMLAVLLWLWRGIRALLRPGG
jgi:prepilin signal peptidase PulO-like enzyme (type II secretory pathway)